MSTVGERIKELRTKLGLSADDLAEKIGKNRATVFRYENGDIERMPLEVLEPIAKALNVSPAVLMGWTDEKIDSGFYAAFSGAGIYDPRVKEHIDKINNQEHSIDFYLSPKEQALVSNYREADDRTRSIVDLALGIQDIVE